jgi:hypothetical protein
MFQFAPISGEFPVEKLVIESLGNLANITN